LVTNGDTITRLHNRRATLSRFNAILVCAIALALCGSCETDQSPKSSAGIVPIINLNGMDVSAAELLKSPSIRQGLVQMCVLDTLWIEFESRGYKIDEEQIEEQMDEARQSAILSGASFAQMLKERMTTEADYRQNLKFNQALERLSMDNIDLSEKSLQAAWEEQRDYFAAQHARLNNLTDKERETLTLEQARDTVEELYIEASKPQAQQDLWQQLIDDTTLRLLAIEDSAERQFFEDLILNGLKTGGEWPVESVGDPDQPRTAPAPDADALEQGAAAGEPDGDEGIVDAGELEDGKEDSDSGAAENGVEDDTAGE